MPAPLGDPRDQAITPASHRPWPRSTRTRVLGHAVPLSSSALSRTRRQSPARRPGAQSDGTLSRRHQRGGPAPTVDAAALDTARRPRRPRVTSAASAVPKPLSTPTRGARIAPPRCERGCERRRHVRREAVDARGGSADRSSARASTSTPLRTAFSRAEVDAQRLHVDREHRRPSEPRGQNRQHAGAAAEVGERARRLDARAAARGTSASSDAFRRRRRRLRAGRCRSARLAARRPRRSHDQTSVDRIGR